MTALDAKISQFVRKGYIVQSQSETSAQLVKPKKFSFLWALVWFCFFGVGLLVYLLYYAAKRDPSVYITTEESARKRRGNSPLWSLAVATLLILMLLCVVVAML